MYFLNGQNIYLDQPAHCCIFFVYFSIFRTFLSQSYLIFRSVVDASNLV